jgi:photosystem II stability/assembly factor-like uncharacterized protein
MTGISIGQEVDSTGNNGLPLVILQTSNGGINWTRQYATGVMNMSPEAITLTSNNIGYIVGINYEQRSNTILKTTNGGMTWISKNLPFNIVPFGISFISDSIGSIVGNGGKIIRTTNGGNNWDSQTQGRTAWINKIFFTNESSGFVIDWGEGEESGSILKTTDGGVSWNKLNVIVNAPSGICFLNDNLGFVVGYGGEIIKTTNGGTSWITLPIGTSDWLMDVFFIDQNVGVAVGGWNGTILHTTNGGSNWTVTEIGLNILLSGVIFTDINTGYSVGYQIDSHGFQDGVVFKTTNAGVSWSKIFTVDDQFLEDVNFIDSSTGFIVGLGGIFKTTNAGRDWFKPIGVNADLLYGIKFLDNTIGIAVGNNGIVLHSTNRGDSWQEWPSPTTNTLTSVHSSKSNNNGKVVYVAGKNSTILCAAISPLNPKIWVGAVDSSWNNPDNWSPPGVPIPGDSVIIAPATIQPVFNQTQQQLTIASLTILSGATFTITDALARFVLLADMNIYGTLALRPPAQTTIVVGGNWNIQNNGGFLSSQSTVNFTGNGTFSKNFYNVQFDSISLMTSNGNTEIASNCYVFNKLNLRNSDTLFVSNNEPQALYGVGKIIRGTIRRAFQQNSTEPYQFESRKTYIQFDTVGTQPQFVSMTTYPDTNPTDFGTQWLQVPSYIDPVNNVVLAESVDEFSRWAIRPPRLLSKNGSEFVRRVYSVNQEGGQNYRAKLSFRYEQSEVPQGVDESTLRLFRLPDSAVSVSSSNNALPKEFALYQNYPNPFNPMTKIKFDLPGDAVVTLKIYNIVGEEVKTILNNALYNAGRKEVEFNSSALSSGIYFYRLVAKSGKENFSSVKKMVVVK